MPDKRRTCTIEISLLNQWKKQYRRNDVKELATLLEVSKPTIYNAVLYGAVHQKRLINGITKFFQDRINREIIKAARLGNLSTNQKQT